MASILSLPADAGFAQTAPRAPVRLWLLAVAALVFAMALVGGATRLTESGLSITEWKPVTGVLPPLGQAEWQAEFDRYKQIPQFAALNPDMTIEGFKTIYWWEWGHRLLARIVGAAFILPALWFWARGALNGKVGAAFTSSATQHGGQESTILTFHPVLLHLGFMIVGLPYAFQGQMGHSEVMGNSPYGASTIAGGDGKRQPSAVELDGARYQGRHIAEITIRLRR